MSFFTTSASNMSGGSGWTSHPSIGTAMGASSTTIPINSVAATTSAVTITGALSHSINGSGSYGHSGGHHGIPMQLNGPGGTLIVKLMPDGTVVWGDNININEAAEAFAKALTVGTELSIGITYGVKQRMRDSVFDELIEIAKAKGSLTAEDLTYYCQAAKIMDKLKGPRD